ncbi:MAG: hypothetical protein ACYDA6_00055 [Solirubrobacteraceae bacterium]
MRDDPASRLRPVDGWVGLVAALAAAFGWDGWALARGHECASGFARRHPVTVGLFWLALAAHFWAPGDHRWDPLHAVSVRLAGRR